jgi:hypothetical protein
MAAAMRKLAFRARAPWSAAHHACRAYHILRPEPKITIRGYPSEPEALREAVYQDLINPSKGLRHVARQANVGFMNENWTMYQHGPFRDNAIYFYISPRHCMDVMSRKYTNWYKVSPFAEQTIFRALEKVGEPLWWTVMPLTPANTNIKTVVRHAVRRKAQIAMRRALEKEGFDEVGRRIGAIAGVNDMADRPNMKEAGRLYGTFVAMIKDPFQVLAIDMDELVDYLAQALGKFQRVKSKDPERRNGQKKSGSSSMASRQDQKTRPAVP